MQEMMSVTSKEKKHLHVTCAVIVDQGQVLAAQRSESMSMPLKWEFPGGKINTGETEEACLKREISEELNVEITILTPMEPYTHEYVDSIVTLYPFICRIKSGVPTMTEHSQLDWFEPDRLLLLDWADADIPVVHNVIQYIQRTSDESLSKSFNHS
jgi:8-oxo-dGTP diphosphatase